MKFGHAQSDQLDEIDFILPPDHPYNEQIWNKPSQGNPLKVFTGCGKWGRKEWVGSVYPPKTKDKDFLSAYAEVFNSVELNNTFYRLSRSSIEEWAKTVEGSDFQFCPKWSRRISHLKRLKEVEENTQYFIDSCLGFGENLGPTFLQLPENFSPKYIDRVAGFLETIPNSFPVFLEVRHKEWFIEPTLTELAEICNKCQIGLAITDTALRRDAVHQVVTIPQIFIRFNGYGLHKSDFQRIDEWVEKIGFWSQKGLQKVYFFHHQADEKHTPVIATYFAKKVKEHLNIVVPFPQIV